MGRLTTLLDALTTWWAPLIAAPFVGSLLSVLVVRLPAGEPVALARSRCRSCGAALGPRDLVPLASWLAARGRCRRCGAPIGRLYPALELAALAVAGWAAAVVPAPWLWPSCALGWTLLALAAIDLRAMLLPDALTLPLAAAGLGLCFVLPEPLGRDRLIGFAAGLAVPALIRAIHRAIRRREGLGLGDVKLFGAAGAWVGWQGLPGVAMVGALAALAALAARALAGRPVGAAEPVPFGPFLCFAVWLVWLYGPLSLR